MKERIIQAIKREPVLAIFYLGMMICMAASIIITPLMILPGLFFLGGIIYDLVSLFVKERKSVTHLEGGRQQ